VTIDAVKYAREKGAKAVALTDDPDGPICKDVDEIWATKSGVSTYNTSPSAPSTAAMVFMLTLVSYMNGEHSEVLMNDISQFRKQGRRLIERAQEQGQKIAEIVDSSELVYLVGEGPNHIAAQIGMMKFDEYSLVKGIAAKTEEFRHHYNLSIKDNEPAVVITHSPPNEEDSVYLRVIGDTLQMKVYQLYSPEQLKLKSFLAQAIPNMIALQFAAYYNALRLDPNKSGFREPHASSFKIY
jgi:fructoselysine 6-phosphate deglycase